MKKTIESTELGNLVFQKENDKIRGIYRQYAKIDFLELNDLKESGKDGIRPRSIDVETLWASFGKDDILSYLQKDLLVLRAVEERLETVES